VSLEAMANQDQVDELLSLQAIYEGDEDVWLHWPEHLTQPPADSTCVGQHGLQLEVDVVIKMSEAVTQQNDTRASELQLLCLQQSDRSTTESSLTVQALPLKLSISLPTSYLDAHCAESVMPSTMVSASWLSTGTRENLESELERQGRESSQTQILFFWIEWLRHEACAFLTSVSTNALPTCETKCADNPNMSLLVSGNLLDLASWSQKREGHFVQKSLQQQCRHCGESMPGSSCRLGTCNHVLCITCIAVISKIYRKNKSTPCCPLTQCNTPMMSDMISIGEQCSTQLCLEDVKHIVGNPIQDVVVFCPRCEDLGVDTPVLTGGARKGEAPETCVCPECDWVFCSICRSPWHGSEDCTADLYRTARMLRRRPPLPPHTSKVASAVLSRAEAPTATPSLEEILSSGLAAKNTIFKMMPNVLDEWAIVPDDAGTYEICQKYDALRWHILQEHGHEICASLRRDFSSEFFLRPAPMDKAVCETFMRRVAAKGSTIRPAFHGTCRANYASIFKCGLLIPGLGNNLEVVNGAVHGSGVYTANVDAAWLSQRFCSHPSILVCAVHTLSAVCVGDAMVVEDASDVIPLFEARAKWFVGRLCSMRPIATLHEVQSTPVKTAQSKIKAKNNKPEPNKFAARLAKQRQKHN